MEGVPMARAGVTREQIFETAEALVREGQSPTVVAVRTRLGGGSPNTIAPLLSEWRALNDSRQAAGLPSVPEPVEAVLRQVWGVAWKEAQGQLETERAALGKLREEIAKERTEMLAEIGRLDGALEAARETVREGREALEAERQAHEQTRSDGRKAQAVADERDKRIAALETELRGEREARAVSDQALTALRVEAATLAERAAHVEELRQVLRSLQEGKGGRRASKPQG
jgi:predicted RNase H-like nuclease (RuvC/YqgF family)